MKKFCVAMSLIFALILSGCGDSNANSVPSENNVPDIEATFPSTPVDSTDMASQPSTPGNSDTSVPDTVEPDGSETVEDDIEDVWYVKTYNNMMPFTPDDYDGPVIDYTIDHITTNGVVGTMSEVTFKDIAFISYEDEPYEGKYSDYLHFGTYTQSNGEKVTGGIFYTTKYFDFLEHSHDGVVDRFFLDIDLPSDISADYFHYINSQYGVYILAQNDNKVLMVGGAYIFTYDFRTSKTNLISDSVLDYKYPVEGELYFTDWDHIERRVDWENDDTITETGNKVIYYRSEDFDLSIQEDFEEEFLAIQASLRSGEATEETYADKYTIFYSGTMFRVSDHERLANIHLPHAYEYNSNLMYPTGYSCWLIEGPKITLYRFGEEVTSKSLFDGSWRIIQSYMSLLQDPTSSRVIFIIDTNNDGKESPEELKAAITNLNIMLMNVDESAVYTANLGESFEKVFTDVVDYRECYGNFYWMDSHGNAYFYDWTENKNNILIGKDAIGIAPFTDEGQGFLVKPDDSRRFYLREGFPLCLDWEGYD